MIHHVCSLQAIKSRAAGLWSSGTTEPHLQYLVRACTAALGNADDPATQFGLLTFITNALFGQIAQSNATKAELLRDGALHLRLLGLLTAHPLVWPAESSHTDAEEAEPGRGPAAQVQVATGDHGASTSTSSGEANPSVNQDASAVSRRLNPDDTEPLALKFSIISCALSLLRGLCCRDTEATRALLRAGIAPVAVSLHHLAGFLLLHAPGSRTHKNGEDLRVHTTPLLKYITAEYARSQQEQPLQPYSTPVETATAAGERHQHQCDLVAEAESEAARLIELVGLRRPAASFDVTQLLHSGVSEEVLSYAQTHPDWQLLVTQPVAKCLGFAADELVAACPVLAQFDTRDLVVGWLVAVVEVVAVLPHNRPHGPLERFMARSGQVRACVRAFVFCGRCRRVVMHIR